MAVIAILAGLVILAIVVQDAFEVMLLPRRVIRRWRLMRGYFRFTWSLWSGFGRLQARGPARERFLAIYGPLSIMLLFGLWAGGLICGYGLILWGVQGGRGFPDGLYDQAYLSGVTFFTLGYGDVLPRGPWARAIAVVEAGSGFGLIAVVIGYLPVLYQLFSRREAHVIQLDARAGSPPAAAEMLRRHAESDGLDKLDEVLRAWEIWAAELLESHLSYPMLAYYRSQHEGQSWLGALAAIMDACALILTGVADIKPLQARMTFAMARQVVVELVRTLDLPTERPTGAERLNGAGYEAMIESFAAVGLTWDGGAQGQETLAAVRATYEPLLATLAEHLLIEVSGWIDEGDGVDHWERGPRGIIARRLVQDLSTGAAEPDQDRPGQPRTPARRLRDRLRR